MEKLNINKIALPVVMEKTYLRVGKEQAEKYRVDLSERGLIDVGYYIEEEGPHILIPIKEGVDTINGIFPDLQTVVRTGRPRSVSPNSYKDLIDLPKDILNVFPNSFDVIGDIALIKIEDELSEYSYDISKALVSFNRNIKKVLLDRGVKGPYRVRDLKRLIGDDMETTHLENNLRFKLDPTKVYFSPRLATERFRIARSIERGTVLDMFAGIGPFSLNIAKHGMPDKVIGIDLNPECIRYFDINIGLNCLEDIVESIHGDAAETIPSLSLIDHVIMNLPHNSLDYIGNVLELEGNPSIILYAIMDEGDPNPVLSRITETASKKGRVLSIKNVRDVHTYSPSQNMVSIEMDLL